MSTSDKDYNKDGPGVEMRDHPDNPKIIKEGECPRCGIILEEEDQGQCGCAEAL